MTNQSTPIYCAIDTGDLNHAKDLIAQIGPITKGIKLGLEFFNAFGPQGIEQAMSTCPEAELFLDLKYHDIPNTVAGAIRSVCKNLAPAYLNVHASGGMDMMRRAMEECQNASNGQTKLIAVTILTSLSQSDLNAVGFENDTVSNRVKTLAKLTQESGLDGVVCSSHEIAELRALCGDDFALMVPGIRPKGAEIGDQKRVMTPSEAIQLGATHLVIGRPITQATDPAQTAQNILDSL